MDDPLKRAAERAARARREAERPARGRTLRRFAVVVVLSLVGSVLFDQFGPHEKMTSSLSDIVGICAMAGMFVFGLVVPWIREGAFPTSPLFSADRATRRKVWRSMKRGESVPDAKLASLALDAGTALRRQSRAFPYLLGFMALACAVIASQSASTFTRILNGSLVPLLLLQAAYQWRLINRRIRESNAANQNLLGRD